jgi:natural product precursor
MKKLEKLKLNHLSKDALDARQKNALKGGGGECRCTCSPCHCASWDGTGTMPPGRSSNDMGLGGMNGYIGGSIDSW